MNAQVPPATTMGERPRRSAPPDRKARQVQHIQYVGIGHLIAQGEADEIKVGDGVAALQAVEGEALGAHLGLHIAPGGKNALAPAPGQIVHHPVQNAHAQVGHTDLIGIREAEGIAHLNGLPVLHYRIIFAARVAGGFLHPWEDAFQASIHAKPPSVSYNLNILPVTWAIGKTIFCFSAIFEDLAPPGPVRGRKSG